MVGRSPHAGGTGGPYRRVRGGGHVLAHPDARWLVDRVTDEPGIGYRIWYQGTPVGNLPDDPGALRAWLAARHVDVTELIALPADEDPFGD